MSDHSDDAFQRALDEAGRKDRASELDMGATSGARVRGLAFRSPSGSGGKARFGLALDWTGEPQEPPATPTASQSPESPAPSGDIRSEIAAALGLGAAITLDELTSRWRDFVWRNHPDRQPEDARVHSNARVAIANTLYDQARRALVKTRCP
jgi:hypothetical protein